MGSTSGRPSKPPVRGSISSTSSVPHTVPSDPPAIQKSTTIKQEPSRSSEEVEDVDTQSASDDGDEVGRAPRKASAATEVPEVPEVQAVMSDSDAHCQEDDSDSESEEEDDDYDSDYRNRSVDLSVGYHRSEDDVGFATRAARGREEEEKNDEEEKKDEDDEEEEEIPDNSPAPGETVVESIEVEDPPTPQKVKQGKQQPQKAAEEQDLNRTPRRARGRITASPQTPKHNLRDRVKKTQEQLLTPTPSPGEKRTRRTSKIDKKATTSIRTSSEEPVTFQKMSELICGLVDRTADVSYAFTEFVRCGMEVDEQDADDLANKIRKKLNSRGGYPCRKRKCVIGLDEDGEERDVEEEEEEGEDGSKEKIGSKGTGETPTSMRQNEKARGRPRKLRKLSSDTEPEPSVANGKTDGTENGKGGSAKGVETSRTKGKGRLATLKAGRQKGRRNSLV